MHALAHSLQKHLVSWNATGLWLFLCALDCITQMSSPGPDLTEVQTCRLGKCLCSLSANEMSLNFVPAVAQETKPTPKPPSPACKKAAASIFWSCLPFDATEAMVMEMVTRAGGARCLPPAMCRLAKVKA